MTGESTPPNLCFGCGSGNARGMKLLFERDAARQRTVGRFRLGAEYQGPPGFIHGGIIATVLDEAMGKVSRFFDVRTVTAELTVEYLRPVRVGQEIAVEGYLKERKGRQYYYGAEIRGAGGELLVRGSGRFVEVDAAKFGQ